MNQFTGSTANSIQPISYILRSIFAEIIMNLEIECKGKKYLQLRICSKTMFLILMKQAFVSVLISKQRLTNNLFLLDVPVAICSRSLLHVFKPFSFVPRSVWVIKTPYSMFLIFLIVSLVSCTRLKLISTKAMPQTVSIFSFIPVSVRQICDTLIQFINDNLSSINH